MQSSKAGQYDGPEDLKTGESPRHAERPDPARPDSDGAAAQRPRHAGATLSAALGARRAVQP